MRICGINYDTGFASGGTTTHEPFEPEVVRREMRIIRADLHCDAVRITGADTDRLEVAARHAADAGLEVWYSPFTNGLTTEQLRRFLLDSAERAERLRRTGARVVFLTGSEISLFNGDFIPGTTHTERLAALTDPGRGATTIGTAQSRVNAFLGEVVAAVRERFGGLVSYASIPFEGVDWEPFDIVATDAGYRDATTPPDFREGVRAQTAKEKPFAVTEFGCAPHRGGAAHAAKNFVEFDDHARPVRLTEPLERDEDEQARYVREMLTTYDEHGVDAAFVYTFARWDLPTSGAPACDFDLASPGVVKMLEPGRTGKLYAGLPWEPKAAFHALASWARDRH